MSSRRMIGTGLAIGLTERTIEGKERNKSLDYYMLYSVIDIDIY